ncbi:MAG: TetR/AcrR family transcriptional regulator [Actinomycetia bacterium]|nr:TetR/AcrR family transcriptional regulator [Actinomycetes bacterium]
MAGTRKHAPKPAAARRNTYHHGDLKRALTSAALALVAEKGPKGFTLSEAARRAQVSVAAPYRHFADKAELLAAAAEQGFIQLHGALCAARDSTSDPKSRVIEVGRAYVRWVVTHPDYYQVMFGADTFKAENPDLLAAATPAFDVSLEAITRCQEAGVMRSQDPREIAGPMWALAHGIASLAISGALQNVGIEDDPETLLARALTASLESTEPA